MEPSACSPWIGAGRLQNYPRRVRQEEQLWLSPGRGGGEGAFLHLAQPENPPRSRAAARCCSASPGAGLQRALAADTLPQGPLGWLGTGIPPVRSRSGATSGPFGFAGDQQEAAKEDQQRRGAAAPAHIRADLPRCRQGRTRANPPRRRSSLKSQPLHLLTSTPRSVMPRHSTAPATTKPASVFPLPPWPFGSSFCFSTRRGNRQSNGGGGVSSITLVLLETPPRWWVSLLPWCCRIPKAGEVGPQQ